MSCLNFIIIKVNGIDVSNLPHDEAIELFLKAEEPILVEVRRRSVEDVNKVCFFNDEFSICTSTCAQKTPNPDESLSVNKKIISVESSCPSDDIPAIVSTDIIPNIAKSICRASSSSSPKHAFCNRSHPQSKFSSPLLKSSNHHHEHLQGVGQFCDSMAPEIDIEEITLRKSRSDEKLGFTVSYSSGNSSAIDSDSDDCDEYTDDNDHDNDDDDDKDDDEENENDTCADIYISDILPDSLAARDGRLRQGDQILQINGRDVSNKDETESLFAENKNAVTLLVSRCIYTDDEFLDSAVYCDDKECQNLSNNQSSSCECEQTSFSSKSSISNSEPASSNPMAFEQFQPITAIDTSICNHLHHFNIKAQLESVNKEINFLNTQISSMKLQKTNAMSEELSPNTSLAMTTELTQNLTSSNSSPTAVVKNRNFETVRPNFHKNREPVRIPSTPDTQIESEIEHIYETIPEDSETDSYYCSPYESRHERNRIEQWLKSQDDSVSKNSSNIDRGENGTLKNKESYSNQITWNPISKNNSSGDDYENSSSAYNTGGSCNSNPLAFELKADDKNQSSSTLVFRPYSQQDEVVKNCKHCQLRNRIISKEKLSPKSIKCQETSGGRGKECKRNLQATTCNSGTFYTNVKSLHQSIKLQHKLFRKSVMRQNSVGAAASYRSNNISQNSICSPLTIVTTSNVNHLVATSTSTTMTTTTATILPDKSSNLIANDKEPLIEPNLEQSKDFRRQEKSEMVWKVKRRLDGSRYIVRRPIKSQQLLEDRARRINEERYSQTTEDETLSEVKAGRYWTKDERKRHVEKTKERRQRQQTIINFKKQPQQQPQQQQQQPKQKQKPNHQQQQQQQQQWLV